MTILALDQSSITSGYSIFCDNQLIESGTFTFNSTILSKRLLKIREQIKQLINLYCIEYVILEDIQLETKVPNNVKTYKALAEVIGVITELLEELKIKYELVAPSSWRSQLNIKGNKRNEQKKNAQNYVLKVYKKDVSEDESDAICIGAYYINKNMSAF